MTADGFLPVDHVSVSTPGWYSVRLMPGRSIPDERYRPLKTFLRRSSCAPTRRDSFATADARPLAAISSACLRTGNNASQRYSLVVSVVPTTNVAILLIAGRAPAEVGASAGACPPRRCRREALHGSSTRPSPRNASCRGHGTRSRRAMLVVSGNYYLCPAGLQPIILIAGAATAGTVLVMENGGNEGRGAGYVERAPEIGEWVRSLDGLREGRIVELSATGIVEIQLRSGRITSTTIDALWERWARVCAATAPRIQGERWEYEVMEAVDMPWSIGSASEETRRQWRREAIARTKARLDQAGALRWELVSIHDGLAFFRRRIIEDRVLRSAMGGASSPGLSDIANERGPREAGEPGMVRLGSLTEIIAERIAEALKIIGDRLSAVELAHQTAANAIDEIERARREKDEAFARIFVPDRETEAAALRTERDAARRDVATLITFIRGQVGGPRLSNAEVADALGLPDEVREILERG